MLIDFLKRGLVMSSISIGILLLYRSLPGISTSLTTVEIVGVGLLFGLGWGLFKALVEVE